MRFFTETMGVPPVLAFLVIVAECFGGLALLIGFMGRIAAVSAGAVMVVAALRAHAPHGFFMNWHGTLPAEPEGFEFFILAVALAVIAAIRGSGAASVDAILLRRHDVRP